MRRGDGALPAMHRTREQLRCGPLARRLGRRVLTGLPHKPTDALAAGRAIARRSRHAEARPEPAEEPIKQLATPAAQASPALPDRAAIDLQAEPRADRSLRASGDEVKPERLEDHGRRVPAPRMQLGGKDADRDLARHAEEAPDRDHELGRGLHEPEHLAPVDPVTDDPEPPASVRRMPAPRAGRRPHRLDGRQQAGKTEQAVDRSRQRPYNLHRSLASKRRAVKRNLAKDWAASPPALFPRTASILAQPASAHSPGIASAIGK